MDSSNWVSVFFLALLLFACFLPMLWMGRQRRKNDLQAYDAALEVLEQRHAKGEISRSTVDSMRQEIEEKRKKRVA